MSSFRYVVIPAQAGIQQDKKAFCFNPLDSGLRRNDVLVFLGCDFNSECASEQFAG